MKRIIGIVSTAFFIFLILAMAANAEQPQSGQAAEKKATSTVGEPETPGQREYREQQRINEKVKQFKADYEKATDKLAFLLSNAEDQDDEILIEVAFRLARFDDPRSIETLKKLEEHRPRKDLARNVLETARRSLEWLAVAPDMKKLKPGIRSVELEALAKKYATNNDTAHGFIYSFLKQEYEKDPETYVPLLVEYYAYTPLAQELAKKYPDLVDKGLEKCFKGSNASIVRSCIELAGSLHTPKYLARIYEVAYAEKGNIDYAVPVNSAMLRDMALSVYSLRGVEALPYLEKILYSKFDSDKSAVISRIGFDKTKEGLNILKRFKEFCATKGYAQDDELQKQLNKTINKL